MSLHTHDLHTHKLLRQHINNKLLWCWCFWSLLLSYPFPIVSTVTCHFQIKPRGVIRSKIHFPPYKITMKHCLHISDWVFWPPKKSIHVTWSSLESDFICLKETGLVRTQTSFLCRFSSTVTAVGRHSLIRPVYSLLLHLQILCLQFKLCGQQQKWNAKTKEQKES